MPQPALKHEPKVQQVKPMTIKEYLSYLGPATIVTMVIMGPGTTSSMLRGGAILGPQAGWIIIVAALTSWWFMSLANKTTCISGEPPLETLYKVWRPLAAVGAIFWFIPQVFIVMVQGVTCAQTAAAITGISPGIIIWPVLLACTLVFYLGKFSALKKVAGLFLFLMCLVSLIFAVRLLIGPELPIGEAFRGLIIPTWPDNPETAVLFAGAIGGAGTWGILAYHGYAVKQAGNDTSDRLWVTNMDSFFLGGVLFALFSLGIFWAAAGVFFPAGIVPETAPQAAELFVPLLGKWAYPLFYAGFLGAVFTTLAAANLLLSTCVFAVLNVYKVGNIDWRPQLENKNFRIFTIISLFIVAGLGSLPGRAAILPALVWSLGVATVFTPPGFALWIYLTNNKKYVGDFKNSWYWNIGLIIMLLILIYLAITVFPDLLRNPFSF